MADSIKILIVDDERNIRCLLSDILSSEGFEVTEATDGLDSLEKMEQNVFDLVITDIRMPRLDGIAMLNRMEQAGRKEKVIILSATSSIQTLSCMAMPRVVRQVSKPFIIEDFLATVIGATADCGRTSGVETH